MFGHSILALGAHFSTASWGRSCAAAWWKAPLTQRFLHFQLPGWPWHWSGMHPAALQIPQRIVLVWWAWPEHSSVILLTLAMPHTYKTKMNFTFVMSKMSNMSQPYKMQPMGTQETQDWFYPCIKSRKACEICLLARYKSGSTMCGHGLEYGLHSMSSKSWLVENSWSWCAKVSFCFHIGSKTLPSSSCIS